MNGSLITRIVPDSSADRTRKAVELARIEVVLKFSFVVRVILEVQRPVSTAEVLHVDPVLAVLPQRDATSFSDRAVVPDKGACRLCSGFDGAVAEMLPPPGMVLLNRLGRGRIVLEERSRSVALGLLGPVSQLWTSTSAAAVCPRPATPT